MQRSPALFVSHGAPTLPLETSAANAFLSGLGREIGRPRAILAATFESRRTEDLVDYRRLAPHAVRNHPTEEHLLPLFVALGAAIPGASARRLHSSYVGGVISMDAYRFD
jgi:aromatic ring-opening dioxygenase catalytic subunit (LigB family)